MAKKDLKVLVTGVAGFIGSHVAAALLARGDKVVGIDNFSPYYDVKLKKDRLMNVPSKKLVFHKMDITDKDALFALCKKEKFDVICHLAAQAGVRYSLTNPHVYESTNMLGTLNIFEAARHHGIKKVVYASSSSVYGGNTKVPFAVEDRVDLPISLYAATKRANELYAHVYHHLFGIDMVGLRFFTVYGPWGRPDMALFLFTKAILAGEPIDLFNKGDMERDFTYVSDIVAGVVASIDTSLRYEIFNLGNSSPVQLTDFIKHIEKALGKKARFNLLPMQPGDVRSTSADIRHSKKLLGYTPRVGVEQGIKEFIAWYTRYYGVKI